MSSTSEKFRRGELSYSKVRAITRVATAETEELLLEIAYHGTAAHLDRVVRGYRFCQGHDAASDDQQRKLKRQLRWYVDADGMWVFHGRMTAEQGALVAKALEACQEEAFDESEEPPDDYANEPHYPAGARRADALERMAESFLAASPKAMTGGDRYLIEIHTDLDSLKSNSKCGGGRELLPVVQPSALYIL